ncbi:MAG TPA: hypothetical protein PKE65_08455, partial [Rhizobiaceae bacterium]|nr:hypothetical protein [Rhizobiaceae bacterium]
SATSEMLGHPGWWAHFWFSNLELQVSMTGFDPPFSIGEMLHGYFRGISVALQHSDWPWLLTILVGAWVLLARNRHVIDRAQSALLFAMLIGLPGKFVSFPLPDDRFYFVFISVMAVVLATVWKPRFDLAEAGKRA